MYCTVNTRAIFHESPLRKKKTVVCVVERYLEKKERDPKKLNRIGSKGHFPKVSKIYNLFLDFFLFKHEFKNNGLVFYLHERENGFVHVYVCVVQSEVKWRTNPGRLT